MSDSIRYLKRKTFTEQPKYLFTAILFSIQRRYAVCFSIRVICRGLESHTSRCEKSGKRRDISSKIPNTESEPDGPRGQMREQTDPEWEFMNTILPKDSSLLHYAIHSCFYWRILADFCPLYGFLRLEFSTATAEGGGGGIWHSVCLILKPLF
jgi:hypothetical protein